jgi:hypothetical protein
VDYARIEQLRLTPILDKDKLVAELEENLRASHQ